MLIKAARGRQSSTDTSLKVLSLPHPSPPPKNITWEPPCRDRALWPLRGEGGVPAGTSGTHFSGGVESNRA